MIARTLPAGDRHQFEPFDFGRRMDLFGLAMAGDLTEESWLEFVEVLAKAIGMTPAYEPQVWRFPVQDKGGEGLTIMQPIVESFIVIDTWDAHRAAYLHICSCKAFDRGPVYGLLRKYGLEPADTFTSSLELPR